MKLPWQKEKEFFTAEEKQQLVNAIQQTEQRTSGEVRLFVESKCRFVNAVDRAKEIFLQLQMHKTEFRNATLVYVATEDHQVAVLGDEGIHQRVGQQYWEQVVIDMLAKFQGENLVTGICTAIAELGEALHQHFPYDQETDKNELPDDIVFGR
ncbi:MAG TPA: TPM domain-containing protein [Flavisolibacter sp.]|nr:TPM domain-containing protein [Flavisolibacter sp.]